MSLCEIEIFYRIVFLPRCGLGASLTELDLCDNMIQVLPPRFGCLKSLESLDLSSNDLRMLPADFKDLVHLTWLKLGHNPHLNVPAAIVNEGPPISNSKNIAPRPFLSKPRKVWI